MITKEEFLNKVKNTINFDNCEKKRKYLLHKMIFLKIVNILFSFLTATMLLKLLIEPFYLTNQAKNTHLYLFLTILFYCLLFYLTWICINAKFKLNEIPDKYKYEFWGNKYKFLPIFGIKQTYNGLKYIDIKNSSLFESFTDLYDDDIFGNEFFTAIETELHDSYEDKDRIIFKGLILLFKTNKQIKSRTIIITKKDINSNHANISLKRIIQEILFSPYLLPIYIAIAITSFTNDGKNMLSSYIYLFSIKSNIGLLSTLIIIVVFFLMLLCIYTLMPLLFDRYKFIKKRYKTLNLESVSFDKRFKVYSENQIEGRYLVTTAFMDRLQNLQTAFGVKNIKCSFYDDNIMFAISTSKDLFELGTLYKPFGKDIEQFYDQIASIYDIIEYFKLNERTGL